MNTFLALKKSKSISKRGKLGLLGLVKSDFMDLIKSDFMNNVKFLNS